MGIATEISHAEYEAQIAAFAAAGTAPTDAKYEAFELAYAAQQEAQYPAKRAAYLATHEAAARLELATAKESDAQFLVTPTDRAETQQIATLQGGGDVEELAAHCAQERVSQEHTFAALFEEREAMPQIQEERCMAVLTR
jgi:hypothetical protein